MQRHIERLTRSVTQQDLDCILGLASVDGANLGPARNSLRSKASPERTMSRKLCIKLERSAMPDDVLTVPMWDEKHLGAATHAAGVALWSWNVDTDAIILDERDI